MPMELQPYILDELINNAQVQKTSQIEKTIIEQTKTNQDRCSLAYTKKRQQVLLENLELIRKKNMKKIKDYQMKIETDLTMPKHYLEELHDPIKEEKTKKAI